MAHITRRAVMAALLAAGAMVPTAAMADHQSDEEQLLIAARELHLTIQRFEVIALQRHLPRYDIESIARMREEACQLVEDLECDVPWYQIRERFRELQHLADSVDRRILRSCRYDRLLARSWQHVQDDLYAVTCLMDGHDTRFGRQFPPRRGGFIDRPDRGGPHDGGFAHRPHRGGFDRGGFDRGPGIGHGNPGGPRFGGVDLGSNRDTPPWLRILVAALSR